MNIVQNSREDESSLLRSSSVDLSAAGPKSSEGLSAAGYAVLFERHAAEILRYAIRCAGRREIAEELASEAFMRMYQNRDRIDPTRAAAWLTTTVKNLATDYWRKNALERRYSAALTRPEVQPPSQGAWEEMLREPALKPEHRACLILHYMHGMERREIASHTGLSENQVKSCLQYGLKLLRKSWGIVE